MNYKIKVIYSHLLAIFRYHKRKFTVINSYIPSVRTGIYKHIFEMTPVKLKLHLYDNKIIKLSVSN